MSRVEEYRNLLYFVTINKNPTKFHETVNAIIKLIGEMSHDELGACVAVTLQNWLPTLEDFLFVLLDEIYNRGADPDAISTFTGNFSFLGGDDEDERAEIRLVKFFIRRGAKLRTLKHLIGLMGQN